MNNPLAIFRNLREVYRRYIDSPLAIRYDALRDDRRALLFDQDRRLWREPLIEPMPAYPLCGATFTALTHQLLDDFWGSGTATEVADFLEPSLFRDSETGELLQPYSHQHEAFRRTLVERRDVVVTTGTGSGKTECFLGALLNLVWGIAGLNQAPSWLFGTQMLVMFANAFVMSNSAAGAISVRPEAAGTASGAMGFLQMGVGSLVSQFGAYLGGHFGTPVPLNIAIVVLSAACASTMIFLVPRRNVIVSEELIEQAEEEESGLL